MSKTGKKSKVKKADSVLNLAVKQQEFIGSSIVDD
jgi:hypothetical protein